MTRKLKEAAVKIDINGLESDDLALLARMMELAGQAEQSSVNSAPDLSQGISALSTDVPDLSTDTGSELDPSMGMSMVSDSGPESDILDQESVDISEPSDIQYDESDSLGDVVGQDDFSTEQDSMFDEDFDMGRMSSLAGLNEDVDSDDDSDDDSEDLDEGRLLPDLSINETPEDINGPFPTQEMCTMNGEMETNGVEGNNFTVISKPDGFYWSRTVQEDVVNRPEPEQYNNTGNENSVHDYRHKRTKLGDNTILSNIHESDEEDEDESVEQIQESLNEKFKQFMGGK